MIVTIFFGYLIKTLIKFQAKLNDIPVDETSVVNEVELCLVFVQYFGKRQSA